MRLLSLAAIALILAATAPALAKNGKPFQNGGFCPPGLAKKNPPCVPPGLAKKYAIGDTLERDDWEEFQEFWNWQALNLPEPGPGQIYYHVDDRLLLLNRKTGELINIIEAVGRFLND